MTKIGQHTLLSRANPKTSLQSRPHIIHIYHVGIPCVLFTQDVMRCAPKLPSCKPKASAHETLNQWKNEGLSRTMA